MPRSLIHAIKLRGGREPAHPTRGDRRWPLWTRPRPSPTTTRRKRISTRSGRSRRSATCRSRCTPGRSAASGTASRTSRFQLEVVDTPTLDSNEVLVFVMAAGVNYNGVWAGLGIPISPFDVHKAPYHIAGSDASGIVWAVGDKVQALEGRRRGRRPLQPGRRRRRALQRRRPDVLAQPADLGLRDAERQLRAVHQRAEPAADGAAAAPDLGGERLLHADAGHRLPDAVRPRAARAAARAERAGLGRLGRPRVVSRSS